MSPLCQFVGACNTAGQITNHIGLIPTKGDEAVSDLRQLLERASCENPQMEAALTAAQAALADFNQQ